MLARCTRPLEWIRQCFGGEATTVMRLNLKPAAASAAAVFLLLIVFSLTWPGHGLWQLGVGLLLGLIAAVLWWQQRFPPDSDPYRQTPSSPFTNVGAYGLAGSQIVSTQQQSSGVPLAGVLAPISALAILLFVGGAIGSAETTVEQSGTPLDQSVTAIDRSGDGEPVTPNVDPPTASQLQQTQTTTTVTSVRATQQSDTTAEAASGSQQSAGPVKPIVVAAPTVASPADEEVDQLDLTPDAANTFEYIVAEGDTLYDIAIRYDSTVEVIMNLNKLDSKSFIHPGDVLLVPITEEEGEES